MSRGKIAPTFGEIVIVERFDLPLIESIEFSNLLQSNYSISGFHVFGFIKENISSAGPFGLCFLKESKHSMPPYSERFDFNGIE